MPLFAPISEFRDVVTADVHAAVSSKGATGLRQHRCRLLLPEWIWNLRNLRVPLILTGTSFFDDKERTPRFFYCKTLDHQLVKLANCERHPPPTHRPQPELHVYLPSGNIVQFLVSVLVNPTGVSWVNPAYRDPTFMALPRAERDAINRIFAAAFAPGSSHG